MDREERIRKRLNLLKPFIGSEKAEKLWVLYMWGDFKKKAKLESMINTLAQRHLDLMKGEPELEPIPEQYCNGDIFLGDVFFKDNTLYPFMLPMDSLIKHVGIFSQTSKGKTNLCMVVTTQLIKKDIPFIIFDIKRNYRELLQFQEFKDIEIFTLGRNIIPKALNMFKPPRGLSQQQWIKIVLDSMEEIFFFGRGVSHILRKLLDKGLNVEQVLDELRKEKSKQSSYRKSAWIDSSLSRIEDLSTIKDVVWNPKGKSIESLLGKKVVLEVDSLNSLERQFVYEIILKYSYYHYLNSQQREQARQLMILEEFQAMLRKNTGMQQEIFIETLFRMGRELGIGLIYICQNISQVPVTILQNTNTTICLNQNHEYDIRGCAFALLLNRDEYQLLSRLPVGHAIMRMSERYTKPFKILVPKMEIEKGKITDQKLKTFRDKGSKDVLQ
jgi:DNA helicase HerA-like ATPase